MPDVDMLCQFEGCDTGADAACPIEIGDAPSELAIVPLCRLHQAFLREFGSLHGVRLMTFGGASAHRHSQLV